MQVDVEHNADERTSLLGGASQDEGSAVSQQFVPKGLARRLYLSHFLSTWNSRVFEFGAVLYLASIYPGTLLPMSAYAFARGLSAIFCAPAVGQFIDTVNRLKVVRVSIVFQRLVVAVSCVVFYILARGLLPNEGTRTSMVVLLAFFACVEKLCSIMNLVSVEKDWVVVVAGKDQASLGAMNAQMRRIDLLCKLFGPLSIALIDGVSTKAAIIFNFAMNVASVVIEYFAIAEVYYRVPELQQPKSRIGGADETRESSQELESRLAHNWRHVRTTVKKSIADFGFHFHHRAFLPSIAGAFLYLTVLSFGGQMVTYLLSAGYSAPHVGIARTLSVSFEIVATWVAPWYMKKIGPVRAGLWSSSWQVTMLVAGSVVFCVFEDFPVVSASGLVIGTALSRVGLRSFDLCTQIIVQEDVEAENRGAFSSVEAAWQNAFELLSYVSTIIFFRPQQFKWPALVSVGAVALASLAYAVFVYMRRGHLLHLEKLSTCLGTEKRRRSETEGGIPRVRWSDGL